MRNPRFQHNNPPQFDETQDMRKAGTKRQCNVSALLVESEHVILIISKIGWNWRHKKGRNWNNCLPQGKDAWCSTQDQNTSPVIFVVIGISLSTKWRSLCATSYSRLYKWESTGVVVQIYWNWYSALGSTANLPWNSILERFTSEGSEIRFPDICTLLPLSVSC